MPFEDKKLRSKLKSQFKVWAMIENGEFGQVCMCRHGLRSVLARWMDALCWFEGSREINAHEDASAHPPGRNTTQDRTSGIPTIVAVDKRGHMLAHMDVGIEGLETLEKHWRYKEWAW